MNLNVLLVSVTQKIQFSNPSTISDLASKQEEKALTFSVW